MTDRIVRMEEDEDSFWEFLTGKTTNEDKTTNKNTSAEYEDRVSKNKNEEIEGRGSIHPHKPSSEGGLVNMLRELDDLDKLDDLDESDDESCTQPLFDEEEEIVEVNEREEIADVFEYESDSKQNKENNEDIENQKNNLKGMSLWKRICNTSLEDGVKTASRLAGLGSVAASIVCFCNLVRGYFKLRSTIPRA